METTYRPYHMLAMCQVRDSRIEEVANVGAFEALETKGRDPLLALGLHQEVSRKRRLFAHRGSQALPRFARARRAIASFVCGEAGRCIKATVLKEEGRGRKKL